MKEHEFNVRVRYSETDQMGWFITVIMLSILRWDAWNGRNLGISYKWMEESGIMLPVVEHKLKTSPI
jgi:acyl-CoA thioester hydrolase